MDGCDDAVRLAVERQRGLFGVPIRARFFVEDRELRIADGEALQVARQRVVRLGREHGLQDRFDDALRRFVRFRLFGLVAGDLKAELDAAVGAANEQRLHTDQLDLRRCDFAPEQRGAGKRKVRLRYARDDVSGGVERLDIDELKMGEVFAFGPLDHAVAEAQLHVFEAGIDHRLEARREQPQRNRAVHRLPDEYAPHHRDGRYGDRGDAQSDPCRTPQQNQLPRDRRELTA